MNKGPTYSVGTAAGAGAVDGGTTSYLYWSEPLSCNPLVGVMNESNRLS